MKKIKIAGKTLNLPDNTAVAAALSAAGLNKEFDVLAARFKGRTLPLGKVITDETELVPVRLDSEEGYRIYRQSLLFVLIMAVWELLPGRGLYVRQSVNKSTYCELSGEGLENEDILPKITEKMREIVARKIPFSVKTVEKDRAIDIFKSEGNSVAADNLTHLPIGRVPLLQTGGGHHVVYGLLTEHTGYLKDFAIEPYASGFLLRYPNPNTGRIIPALSAPNKIFETLEGYRNWSEIIGITDVFHLNKLIEEGRAAECINISEVFHEQRLVRIAQELSHQILTKKVVLISGPTSSGKTTFANRLNLHLRAKGIRPVIISLDDYFVERHKTPVDEDGEYNFEDLGALDHALFNQHLSELIAGKRVEIPQFDFTVGDRAATTRELKLEPDQILIVEGIHALNERLSHSVHHKHKFKIYCTPLTVMCFDRYNPISPTDTRLIRRIIRDHQFRNSPAQKTFSMWPSVQRGEIKNVFPFEGAADFIFNSSTVYEFSAYKNIAEKVLSTLSSEDEHYSGARRLLEFLECFLPINEKYIPPMSILREFIGGSSIKY